MTPMEIGPAQWLSRDGSNGYLLAGRILWRISWRIFVGLFHWEKIVVFGANLFPRFVADWLDRQIAGKIRQEGRQNPPRSQRAVPNKSARGENNSARVAGKSARPVKKSACLGGGKIRLASCSSFCALCWGSAIARVR